MDLDVSEVAQAIEVGCGAIVRESGDFRAVAQYAIGLAEAHAKDAQAEVKFQKAKVERLEDEVSRMIRRAQISEAEVERLRGEVARLLDMEARVQATAENLRMMAAAPQLLEACEAVSRLVEILDRKIRLVSQRRGGSFGIAVDDSPIGKEWQALDAEERAIRGSVDAAIRAAREG